MIRIRKFEDIPVSTKTAIIMTNLTFDIEKLYNVLPITEYKVIPKKRGRKKKVEVEDPNKDIANGSIITIEYKNNLRGVRVKKKKKSAAKKGEDYFRNAITIVMVLDGKNLNFKISKNGKFQMTGCKSDTHTENCLKFLWNYIKDTEAYTMNEDHFSAIFIPAMRNIDFELGFPVDREKLDNYFNTQTNYCSILETSIGYTGVNIKIPFEKPITELMLKKLTWNNNDWNEPEFIPYSEYLSLLNPKEQDKKINKNRHHTFLVFQSGKTIMSSISEDYSKPVYYQFMNIIKRNRQLFEEKLESN